MGMRHCQRVTLVDTNRIAAILLLVLGTLGLAYGGFSYTKQTHEADVGPLHLSVGETRHVNIPIWAGAGAILIGGFLLVAGIRR